MADRNETHNNLMESKRSLDRKMGSHKCGESLVVEARALLGSIRAAANEFGYNIPTSSVRRLQKLLGEEEDRKPSYPAPGRLKEYFDDVIGWYTIAYEGFDEHAAA